MYGLTAPVQCDDHCRGDAAAPVTLVVYGSYLHPRCAAAERCIGRLLHALPGALRVAFRHFPLPALAPGAQLAAELAEAAAAQGAFWPMHAYLLRYASAADAPDVVQAAAWLGLDARRIVAELDARTHAPRVAADVRSGIASGVNGIPTGYINGRRYTGPWSPQELRHALAGAGDLGISA